MDWDPAIAIPTLVGSLLSLVASTVVIICWLVFGGERRSFRYALILNLTVAEFCNSLNNSISGLYIIINHGEIQDGPACDLNGWVGQFSVQAVDFSILAIAVVTLLTIQFKSYILHASTPTKALICASIWIVPLITSTTALALDTLKPVSGNWCWIGRDHEYLRYALGHGWRLAIIVLTATIYVYVFAHMRTRLRLRREEASSSSASRSYSFNYGEKTGFEMNFWLANDGPGFAGACKGSRRHHGSNNNDRYGEVVVEEEEDEVGEERWRLLREPPKVLRRGTEAEAREKLIAPPRIRIRRPTALAGGSGDVEGEVWRVVLLNLYPLTYLLLWLPGLANRVVEATGGYSRVLGVMQSSTQWVGVANACVYGVREHWGDVGRWWGGRGRGR